MDQSSTIDDKRFQVNLLFHCTNFNHDFNFWKKELKKQFKFKTNKIKIDNIIINEIIKQKDTTQKIKKN